MTYLSLSSNLKFWLLIIIMTETLVTIEMLLNIAQERIWNWKHNILMIINVIMLLDYGYLSFQKIWNRDGKYIDFIPVWVHDFVMVAILMFMAFVYKNEWKYRKRAFANASIRAAVDKMPISLCVSDKKGHVILANKNMNDIVLNIIGEPLINMEHVWECLLHEKLAEGNKKLERYSNTKDMQTIMMSEGRIVRATRAEILIKGESYVQHIISDVTTLHKLYAQTEKDNDALIIQRNEIKKLAEELINSNHEEEILNRKIHIHNELGQMILATKQVLETSNELSEYKEIANIWRKLTPQLIEFDKTKNSDSDEQLQEIIEVAEKIGCRVDIADDVCFCMLRLPIIRQAVRESVINAVRHGGAESIFVSDISDGDNLGIAISNDGILPDKNGMIAMKGGLLNLKNGIKLHSGTIEIESPDINGRFSLNIQIPRKEFE